MSGWLAQLTMLNAKYHADCLPIKAGLIIDREIYGLLCFPGFPNDLIIRLPEDHNIKAHSSYEYISKEFDI